MSTIISFKLLVLRLSHLRLDASDLVVVEHGLFGVEFLLSFERVVLFE